MAIPKLMHMNSTASRIDIADVNLNESASKIDLFQVLW